MAKGGAVFTLKSNRLPALKGQAKANASALVRRTAFAILAGTQDRAPVDTGALRASYSVEMDGDLTAIVGTNIEYAVPVELGSSRSPAQPHLIPAAEAERAEFEAGAKELLK